MIREIVHDPLFLARKSEPCAADDIKTAEDLLDTLSANKETCVGMAANMIGVLRRVIVFDNDGEYMTMFDPEIIKADKPYNTTEGCLSLIGEPRPVKRYKSIKVRWKNEKSEIRIKTFTGRPAQIIQHEIDHCNGILI